LLLWQPAPQRVLLIGVGGGSIPMALAAVRPAMDIDGVDIDPAVLRVATRFFGLRPGPRLRLHVVDGAAFVAQARARGGTYDAVLLDAFDENGVPPALFGEAFLRDVKAVLAPDGVFLANTVAGPAHERELAAASAVFGRFHTIRPAPWTNNRLLVAARDPSGLPAAAGLFAGAARHGRELERLGIDEPWLRQLEIVGAGVPPDRAGDASGPMMPDARMRDGMPVLPKVLSEPRSPAGPAR
ncbi:MAG TPA: fused MFS/spermidine synthase, partial [Casimicrobiaceae bacterium]|nr:fused MFS/spermidine synthase [Casimicrobiaceae bacterium]